MSMAQTIMNMANPVTLVLDELSVFPANVSKGVAAVALNTDTVNELILDFTLVNNNTLTIAVPASVGWSDVLPVFKSVDLNAGNLSTSYKIHIKENNTSVYAGGGA